MTNGAVDGTGAITISHPGEYYWAAFYTGDTHNHPAVSGCADEPLTTTKKPAEMPATPFPEERPAKSIVKSASPTTFTAAGQVITYTYHVTNTGTVALHDVAVTDSKIGAVTCPQTTLAPGESMTCTARYTTTAADVAAGHIANAVKETAKDPEGNEVDHETEENVPLERGAAISLVKSARVSGFTAAGQAITYNYHVTNTGRLSLREVTVTDAMPGLSKISCSKSTLGPLASMTCTATYTTTKADVSRGSITNTGVVTGKPPGHLPPVKARSTVTLRVNRGVGFGRG